MTLPNLAYLAVSHKIYYGTEALSYQDSTSRRYISKLEFVIKYVYLPT
jgi:hypothetical protein